MDIFARRSQPVGSARRLLPLLVTFLAACALPAQAREGDWASGRLEPGTPVSVRFHQLSDDVRLVESIELEDPDRADQARLAGPLDSYDPATGELSLLGIMVTLSDQVPVVDADGEPVARDILRPGVRIKIEGEVGLDGIIVPRVVEIRRRQQRSRERVQGPIASWTPGAAGRGTLVVLGLSFTVDEVTQIIDRKGRRRAVLGGRFGVVDDDDLLLSEGRRIGERATLSGEVRVRGKGTTNRQLGEEENDGEADARLQIIAGLAARPGPLFTYIEGLAQQSYAFAGDSPFDEDERDGIWLREAYVVLPVAPRLSLSLGRQSFVDDRRWFYDTRSLDAARLVLDLFPLVLEVGYGRDLFSRGAPDSARPGTGRTQVNLSNEETDTLIARASWGLTGDARLEAFYVERTARTTAEQRDVPVNEPEIFGLRLLADPGRHVDLWADWARNEGFRETRDRITLGRIVRRPVSGDAFDVGVSFRPRTSFDPSLTLGYASADGERSAVRSLPLDEREGVVDRSFYQSDMHRNRGRFNGRVTFRTYGIALDPQLSNLSITTAGVGIRPNDSLSVDLVYHGYSQDEPARELLSAARRSPYGVSDDIGEAWDLVIGYRPTSRFELRANVGRFLPGAAFDPKLATLESDRDDPPVEGTTTVRVRARYRF